MLTHDEIKMLMKALDALQKAATTNFMMTSLLTTIVTPKDQRDNLQEDLDREAQEMKESNELLEERITLLKAKLIEMKDKVMIDEMLDSIKELKNE
jgi:phage shock protein A